MMLMSPVTYAKDQFPEVSAKELKQILDSGQKVFLLNSLSDIIFNQGFIPGSKNIELAEIPGSKLLPKNKSTLIVTYCMGRT